MRKNIETWLNFCDGDRRGRINFDSLIEIPKDRVIVLGEGESLRTGEGVKSPRPGNYVVVEKETSLYPYKRKLSIRQEVWFTNSYTLKRINEDK